MNNFSICGLTLDLFMVYVSEQKVFLWTFQLKTENVCQTMLILLFQSSWKRYLDHPYQGTFHHPHSPKIHLENQPPHEELE